MKDFLKDLAGISPFIRRAWDGHMIGGWELKQRVIFDYEIVYIMEGEAIINIDDRQYKAESGEVYFFRPGISHSMKVPKNSILRQPHIHFDLYTQADSEEIKVSYKSPGRLMPEEMKYFREDINEKLKIKFPDRIKLKNRNQIENLLFEIINDQEKPDSYTFLRSKAYFIELLVCLLAEIYGEEKQVVDISPLSMEIVNSIAEYMRLHYRKKLDILQLSKMAGVSKSYFLWLFKQTFKTSPMQYQIDLKIERAKQMISTYKNTITEVAQYLGFCDVQHFSKSFKRKTGLSPTEFRARNEM